MGYKSDEPEKGSAGFVHIVIVNFIRLVLILTLLFAFFKGRNLILVMAFLGLVMTFIPTLSRIFFRKDLPASLEIITFLFVFGLLLFGSVRGMYAGFWWWDVLLTFGAAIALGFIGLTIFHILDKSGCVKSSPAIVLFFTFCFAFSLGALWELFEFMIDTLFGFGLQLGLVDTMKDLAVNFLGALIVSLSGFLRLRSGKNDFFSLSLFNFLNDNFNFANPRKSEALAPNYIEGIVMEKESERLEFKSTLRRNLHTGDFDKNMEHAVLKTIVAYLNSRGGSLLVGVGDAGEAIGVEEDQFPSKDKLELYFASMLKNQLGNGALPYIRYEVYPYKGKSVLKIDCLPSDKRIFLKWADQEEFYIRHGPSSLRLSGGDLIDYVQHRFG
ncbi:MAG: ATP-binding protein [Nanoarchaeota archaeon]|nr:ATP-binding protein [Nanoarchaeota archaeon]